MVHSCQNGLLVKAQGFLVVQHHLKFLIKSINHFEKEIPWSDYNSSTILYFLLVEQHGARTERNSRGIDRDISRKLQQLFVQATIHPCDILLLLLCAVLVIVVVSQWRRRRRQGRSVLHQHLFYERQLGKPNRNHAHPGVWLRSFQSVSVYNCFVIAFSTLFKSRKGLTFTLLNELSCFFHEECVC
jgi:hypothetical protein